MCKNYTAMPLRYMDGQWSHTLIRIYLFYNIDALHCEPTIKLLSALAGGDPAHDVCGADLRPPTHRRQRSCHVLTQDQSGGGRSASVASGHVTFLPPHYSNLKKAQWHKMNSMSQKKKRKEKRTRRTKSPAQPLLSFFFLSVQSDYGGTSRLCSNTPYGA